MPEKWINDHDIVTGLLAENARKVFASNLADKFAVYSREEDDI